MKIVSNYIDKLNGKITIEIAKKDYAEQENSELLTREFEAANKHRLKLIEISKSFRHSVNILSNEINKKN